MLATILEVLSLVGIPLGLLVLGASLIALAADGRWISTTAYLEDGPPRALHWISDAGEVGSRALRDDDPLAPAATPTAAPSTTARTSPHGSGCTAAARRSAS
ncbi:hypothetical protein Q0F99_09220 [Rathayibacter oskolensis]|uniref:hypothetical protein n=1 Tax=Rathayibacter oskolensis TaxID=1891671 RepID=UPI00265F7210|nr:hypothetical protein [Rathayibacter oskolensis]WKK73013.1 hypothetical protein Q0F99_09220 [Rathayibacter oskolensis]